MGEDKKITKLNSEEHERNSNLSDNLRSTICLMIDIQRENESLARKITILRTEVARLQNILVEVFKENHPRN